MGSTRHADSGGSADGSASGGALVTELRLVCLRTREEEHQQHRSLEPKVGGVKILSDGADITSTGTVTAPPPHGEPLDIACPHHTTASASVLGGLAFAEPTWIDAYVIVTSSFTEAADPASWVLEGRAVQPSYYTTQSEWTALHYAPGDIASTSSPGPTPDSGSTSDPALPDTSSQLPTAVLPKGRLLPSEAFRVDISKGPAWREALTKAALQQQQQRADLADPSSFCSDDALGGTVAPEADPLRSSCSSAGPSQASAGEVQRLQRHLYLPNGVGDVAAHKAFLHVLSQSGVESGRSDVVFHKENVTHWGAKGALLVVRHAPQDWEALCADASRHQGETTTQAGDKAPPSPRESRTEGVRRGSAAQEAQEQAGSEGVPQSFLVVMWVPYCLLLTLNGGLLSKDAMKTLDNVDVPFCDDDHNATASELVEKYPQVWKYAAMLPERHLVGYQKKEPKFGGNKSVAVTSAAQACNQNLWNPHRPFLFKGKGATQFCEALDKALQGRPPMPSPGSLSLDATLADITREQQQQHMLHPGGGGSATNSPLPSALKQRSTRSLPAGPLSDSFSAATPTGSSASPTMGFGNGSFGNRLGGGGGGGGGVGKLSFLSKISRSFNGTAGSDAASSGAAPTDSPRSPTWSPRGSRWGIGRKSGSSAQKGGAAAAKAVAGGPAPQQQYRHSFDHSKLSGINIKFLQTEADEYFEELRADQHRLNGVEAREAFELRDIPEGADAEDRLSETHDGTEAAGSPSNASFVSTMAFHVMKPVGRDEWDAALTTTDSGDSALTQEGWEAIKVRCYEGGIQCPAVRKEVWSYLLGLYEVGDDGAAREERFQKMSTEYDGYKSQWKMMTKAQEKNSSSFREDSQRVEKDVLRTDRSIPMYAQDDGEGLNALRNVLITYATKYNPDLGYCQGMSDVVSTLYYVLQCEVLAFWALTHVLEERNLKIYFQKTQSGIAEKLRFIGSLLHGVDPSLCQYLEGIDAGNFNFCFRWIIVLFKREFAFSDVMYLWDAIWACPFGDDFHLLLSTYLLSRLSSVIQMSGLVFDEILKLINDLSHNIPLEYTLLRTRELYDSLKEGQSGTWPTLEELVNATSPAGSP